MDNTLMENLAITQSLLNFLYAGYQGKYVYLNILKQFSSKYFNHQEFVDIPRILDKLGKWAQEIWKENPIICKQGTGPFTPEAAETFEIAKKFKQELIKLSSSLRTMLSDYDYYKDAESVQYAVASLGFYSYAREHFIKGLIYYCERFKYEEGADRYRQHLISVQNGINITHYYLGKIEDASLEKDLEFYLSLWNDTFMLPFMFLVQVQDINIWLGRQRGQIEYSLFGIPDSDARKWESMSIRPDPACYWEAYGFTPEEASVWIKEGFITPGYAADWRYRHISIEDAVKLHDAGFSPREAHIRILKGFQDPELLIRSDHTD